MTESKRILLNVVATYGRSLFSLVCGLFTGRWVLMALGQSDYGLYGVVGGLTAFIAFVNGLLSMAVGRFYAVNVGAARRSCNKEFGLEECRRWFNTALMLHSVVPLCLIAIGHPIGLWAISDFLNIPPDRLDACVWIWRFVSLSCLVGMLNVPFVAMYNAKQEIAELTIYSFATTSLNVIFFYYMVTHSADWLVPYAMWMCAMSVVPQVIIAFRAVIKYPECRFVWSYWFDIGRVKDILVFAGARFLTAFSSLLTAQGQAILVNKYMGAVYNASMSVGNHVSSQASTLSGALSGAFWPAIANSAGEGALERVRKLSFMTCRLGSALVLIFALPLCLEIHQVIDLWLDKVPPFAYELCVFILVVSVLERMSEGYWMAIMAIGKGVTKYAWTVGVTGSVAFFATWLLFAVEFGMWSVGIALVSAKLCTISARLVLGRPLAGLSARYWLRHVFVPVALLATVSALSGYAITCVCPASLFRVVLTTVCCEGAFLPCAWFLVLDYDERTYVSARVGGLLRSVRGK